MNVQAKRSNQVVISYRREDSAAIVGRIYDRLVEKFGRDAVFKDVDSIPLGVDFRRHLDSIVAECSVLLVVVGEKWFERASNSGLSRLEDPRDFVRIEVESALRRNIPVIPLLVQNASLPSEESLPEAIRELSFRNGMSVGYDPHFQSDMARLIGNLELILASVVPTTEAARESGNGGGTAGAETSEPPGSPPSRYDDNSEPAVPQATTRMVWPWRASDKRWTTQVALAVIGAALPIGAGFPITMVARSLLHPGIINSTADSDWGPLLTLIGEVCALIVLGGLGALYGSNRPDGGWRTGAWLSSLLSLIHLAAFGILFFDTDFPAGTAQVMVLTILLIMIPMVPLFGIVGACAGALRVSGKLGRTSGSKRGY